MKYLQPSQQITIQPPRLSISINPPILKEITYAAAEHFNNDVPIDTTICIHAIFHPHVSFHYTITKKYNGWSRQVHIIYHKDIVDHNCPFSNKSSSSK